MAFCSLFGSQLSFSLLITRDPLALSSSSLRLIFVLHNMQTLHLHERTFSRRKLDFKKSEQGNAITPKRLRASISAGLKDHVKTSSLASSATIKRSLHRRRRGSKQECSVAGSYGPNSKDDAFESHHYEPAEIPNESAMHLATEDVVPCSQRSMVVDVAPLAQLTTSLGVSPFDPGPAIRTVDSATLYQGPFPSFSRPAPEECSEVCQRLWQLHGLEDYAKHRVARIASSQALALEYDVEKSAKMVISPINGSSSLISEDVEPRGHPRERQTVLDSLVGTILSQNTTDTNSRRAFTSLKARFPTWEKVYEGDPKALEDAIRCGGLAEIKASRILNILRMLKEERGKLCLEYVREMSTDEIKVELSRFKGVGPKTIACVLMFHLQQNEFPVDTHVFRITKMLGWVPAKADREKAYLHLNHRVPDHLKFDLHCLLVTHGKRCPRCAKGGRTQRLADGPCPLVNLNVKLLEDAHQLDCLRS